MYTGPFLLDPFIPLVSNRAFWSSSLAPWSSSRAVRGASVNSDACLEGEMRCLLAVLSSLYNDVWGSCAHFWNFPSIIDILWYSDILQILMSLCRIYSASTFIGWTHMHGVLVHNGFVYQSVWHETHWRNDLFRETYLRISSKFTNQP